MKNCLVTKLKASTGNTNLLRVGEMRIGITPVDSPNVGTQSLTLGFNQPVDLEIIGDGYFTDSTLVANLGKSLKANTGNNTIYFSNGNYILSIRDKYSLTTLLDTGHSVASNTNKAINIEDLKYSYNLEYLTIRGNAIGNISSLSNLTKLINLNLSDCIKLTGNISSLSGLINLNSIGLRGVTKLTGNVSSLSNLTNLTNLSLLNTSLTGDVSSLSGLTKLINFTIGKDSNDLVTSTPICSNIAAFNAFDNLTELGFKGMPINGNLSLLPSKLIFFSNKDGVSNCTWSNRPTTSSIFAIEGSVKVDNIDTMLNNLAECAVLSHPSQGWYNTISIRGRRTSASDAAIQTLQSKGYTVSITPA